MKFYGDCCKVCESNATEMTSGCDVCGMFWTCSKKCAKSGFAHKSDCVRRQNDEQNRVSELYSKFTIHKSVTASMSSGLSLDIFNPEEQVLVQLGTTWRSWEVGTVVNTQKKPLKYTVKLMADGRLISLPATNPRPIRRKDFDFKNPLELLLHHLRWIASPDILQEIIDHYHLDINLVGPKLLFECAKYGIQGVWKWLIFHHKIDPHFRDNDGRNILQIAVQNLQYSFLSDLVRKEEQMLAIDVERMAHMTDNINRNVIHYLSDTKNEQMLTFFLDGEGWYAQFIYNSAKVRNDPHYGIQDTSLFSGKFTVLISWIHVFIALNTFFI